MMCCDKINDFFEFREMCSATNIQTRKLLGLPPETPKPAAKGKKNLKQIMQEVNEAESIFGVVGDEIKVEDSAEGKKGKKVPKTKLIRTKNGKIRKLTKKEQEIALELERIKTEEEMETKVEPHEPAPPPPPPPLSSARSRKRGKINANVPLLTQKAPNKREKMREIEQQKLEKKR